MKNKLEIRVNIPRLSDTLKKVCNAKRISAVSFGPSWRNSLSHNFSPATNFGTSVRFDGTSGKGRSIQSMESDTMCLNMTNSAIFFTAV